MEWGGKFARLRLKQKIEMLLFHSFSVFALDSAGILNSVSLHNMAHPMVQRAQAAGGSILYSSTFIANVH